MLLQWVYIIKLMQWHAVASILAGWDWPPLTTCYHFD